MSRKFDGSLWRELFVNMPKTFWRLLKEGHAIRKTARRIRHNSPTVKPVKRYFLFYPLPRTHTYGEVRKYMLAKYQIDIDSYTNAQSQDNYYHTSLFSAFRYQPRLSIKDKRVARYDRRSYGDVYEEVFLVKLDSVSNVYYSDNPLHSLMDLILFEFGRIDWKGTRRVTIKQ